MRFELLLGQIESQLINHIKFGPYNSNSFQMKLSSLHPSDEGRYWFFDKTGKLVPFLYQTINKNIIVGIIYVAKKAPFL